MHLIDSCEASQLQTRSKHAAAHRITCCAIFAKKCMLLQTTTDYSGCQCTVPMYSWLTWSPVGEVYLRKPWRALAPGPALFRAFLPLAAPFWARLAPAGARMYLPATSSSCMHHAFTTCCHHAGPHCCQHLIVEYRIKSSQAVQFCILQRLLCMSHLGSI